MLLYHNGYRVAALSCLCALGVARRCGGGIEIDTVPTRAAVEGGAGPVLISAANHVGTAEHDGVAATARAATTAARRLRARVSIVLNEAAAGGIRMLVHHYHLTIAILHTDAVAAVVA